MARFGLRRGKPGDGEAPDQGAQTGAGTPPPPPGTQPGSGSTPGTAAQPTGGAAATQPPSTPATGSHPTAAAQPSVTDRLEGQRAWLAQLDRRVGVRTYAGAAALVIALAAAAVALVLVLQLDEESAKSSDIDQLREEIAGVEDSATQAAQEDVQSLTERIGELETELAEATSTRDETEQQLSVIEDDIADLREQIAELDQGSGSGGANSP